MNTLPESKSKNDCFYDLIKRTDEVALYSQRYSPNGQIIGYEVFEIKIAPAVTMWDKEFPERELFPGNENFGTSAWAFDKLETAQKKYDELTGKLSMAETTI